MKLSSASAKKLVLGMPWYGYVYPCLNAKNLNFGEVCQTPVTPFRGVNCSDAAGGQVIFSDIMKMVRNSSVIRTPVVTNTDMSEKDVGSYATFNLKWEDEKWNTEYRKFYFDNPATLSEKYAAAKDLNLRGIAIWSVDMIYVSSSESERDAKEMWEAFGSFL